MWNPKSLPIRALLLQILLFSLVFTINHANCSGLQVDVFTQKTPHDGKGLHIPSDTFMPFETIILYTFVSYNEDPITDAFVTYVIIGPSNSGDQSTIIGIGTTNETGIASFSFKIHNEGLTSFGEWNVVARVNLGEIVSEDSLVFKIGWIVDIISIRTVSKDFEPKAVFSINSSLGISVALRNNAFCPQNVSLCLSLKDETNVILDSLELDNFVILTEDVIVYFLNIPQNAAIGNGTVYVSAFTASPLSGGVLFCPEKSVVFSIVKHDISVDIAASKEIIKIGDLAYISIKVRNLGTLPENFNVSIYCNSEHVETMLVESLQPNSERLLKLTWNTSNLSEGTYAISACVRLFDDEVLIDENCAESRIILFEQSSTSDPSGAVLDLVPANHLWLIYLLALGIFSLVSFLVIFLFYKREQRQRKCMDSFDRAWKYWYSLDPDRKAFKKET